MHCLAEHAKESAKYQFIKFFWMTEKGLLENQKLFGS